MSSMQKGSLPLSAFKRLSSRRLGLGLSLPGLAALAVLAACSKTPAPPEPVRSVRSVLVAPGSVGASQEFAGEVRARVETRVSFRVGGKLVSRHAEVGQAVKAGQLLAQLDAGDLRLAQEAAQAQVKAALTQSDLAAAELKRYEDLFAQGFIGALELERRKASFTSAKAQLDQARAQAQVQSNQAGYSRLSAPAAGVVLAVEVEPGAVLAAGTPVMRIAVDGPRDAVFSVPEDGVQALRALIGQEGAVGLRTWAGGPPLKATVREVAAAADASTRTFTVKADLGRGTGSQLQLGQTVTAVLAQGPAQAVIKLPLTAVFAQGQQSAVWVVEAGAAAGPNAASGPAPGAVASAEGNYSVRAQPIVVAAADGNDVVVASGLKPGMRVVTAGAHLLAPGQKVKLLAESASTKPAVAPAPTPTAASAASR